MASLTRDLRYALRMLRRSPGYTSIAILTLAISIGANTAIFSFVDGMLLKPLPYADADRIVRVMEKPPQGERNSISTLNFLDWQRDNTVFDFIAAQTGGGATLTGVTEPVQLRDGRVSADYFRIFGIEAALGRTFASGEDQLGNHRVVILSHALWVSQFGSDPGIVNRRILLDNQPHTVIVPGKTELGPEISWEVVGMIGDEKIGGPADDQSAGVYVSNEQSPVYGMVLSVRGNIDPSTLQKAIASAIHSVSKDQAIIDVRTVDQIRDMAMAGRRLQSVLLGVFGSVALVLAGLGVYGVISYSVAQRTREMGIRAALGASKPSLLRLVLNRGAWLTAIGLAIGIAGALALTRLLGNLLYNVSPRDPATMTAVAVTLAVVAGLASYVPARRATKVDPVVALRYE